MIGKERTRVGFGSTRALLSPEFALPTTINIPLCYMNFSQYNSLTRYDISELINVAREIGVIQVDIDMQLDDMRKRLESMKETGELLLNSRLTDEWCFLDAKWKSRIYRIDDAREGCLRVRDVIEDGLYVLDLKSELSVPELIVPIDMSLSESQPCIFERANLTLPIVKQIRRWEPFKEGWRKTQSVSFDESCLSSHDDHVDPVDAAAADYDNNDNDSTHHIDSDCDNYSDLSDLSENDEVGIMKPPETPTPTEIDNSFPKYLNEKEEALFNAAKRGRLDEFQEIVEAGASLTTRDRSGRTPLHLAAKYGRNDIVNCIVDKVAEFVINIADKENFHTALHVAALHKQRTICRSLIERGASATRLDINGLSPRGLALNSQDVDLAKYLQRQERWQEIAADKHETDV